MAEWYVVECMFRMKAVVVEVIMAVCRFVVDICVCDSFFIKYDTDVRDVSQLSFLS